MTRAERMNSASNVWEADPWDAPDSIADAQRAGFNARAAETIGWTSVRNAGPSALGIEKKKLIGADVEFYATHDGEDMLLMQLAWHGFPDPPEWRLVTRSIKGDGSWASWGYFANLPENWQLPFNGS